MLNENFHLFQHTSRNAHRLYNKLSVLTVSINDFPGLSKKKETIHPPFNPQSKILRRATSQSLNS
jgi:hypothetical protein